METVLKYAMVILLFLAIAGMWQLFKWGGWPTLAGAALVMAVYELGYRATFGHWLDWKSGPRHQHLQRRR